MEQSLRQSLTMSADGMLIFTQRPVAATLFTISAVLIGLIAFRRKKNELTEEIQNADKTSS